MGARTYEGIQSAKHLLFLVLIPEPPASTNEDSLRILDIGRVLSQGWPPILEALHMELMSEGQDSADKPTPN